MEDGAPGHQKYAKRCRQINGVDSLPWPPQSPDLNLIEILWSELEIELGLKYGRISDLELLKEKLLEEWRNIGRDRLLALVKTMPDRLRAVIAAGGGPTSY